MPIPGKLKPFPSPAPRADGAIDPFVVRGNDNLLVQTLNALIEQVNMLSGAVGNLYADEGGGGGDGEPGPPGVAGAAGSAGAAGTAGRDGVNGMDGEDGTDGDRGPPGNDGQPGAAGRDGEQPLALLQLVAYLAQRVWVLEQYCNIEYKKRDLWRPKALTTLKSFQSLPKETREWMSY